MLLLRPESRRLEEGQWAERGRLSRDEAILFNNGTEQRL